MSVQVAFNAQSIDPNFGAFTSDPIWSDGWNKVIITDTRSQEIADKSKGSMLVLAIRAIEGPDTGKTGTLFINYWHTDPVQKDKAGQRLAAVCFAVGVFGFQSTAEMENKPFYIENKTGQTRKAPDGKEYPQNNFTGVRNLAGVEPGTSGQQQGGGQAPQAPQAPGFAPPPGTPQPPAQPPQGGGWAPPPQQPGPTPPQMPQGGGWTPPGAGAPAAPYSAPQPAPAGFPGAPQGGQPAYQPPPGQPQQQWQQPPQGGQPQQQQWQPQGGAPAPQGGQPAWQPPR